VPVSAAQPQFPHSQISQVQNSPLQFGQRQSVQPHDEPSPTEADDVATKPKPVAAATSNE
jgi:hypothetical protein